MSDIFGFKDDKEKEEEKETIPDIFKEAEEKEIRTLFKDEANFSADYEPQSLDEVKHRKKEMDIIVEAIRKVTNGHRSELYVHGVSGVGKTYCVKAILDFLPKDWAEKFQWAWVNCKTIQPLSGYQVMHEIYAQINGWSGRKGFATKEKVDLVISRHKVKPLLVVFDEADALAPKSSKKTGGKLDAGKNIIYTLLTNKISQIFISNVFDWEDNLGMKIASRAKTKRVDFPPYTKEQMVDILRMHACMQRGEG